MKLRGILFFKKPAAQFYFSSGFLLFSASRFPEKTELCLYIKTMHIFSSTQLYQTELTIVMLWLLSTPAAAEKYYKD